MNLLECQACGTPAPADAHHCENCGSADWRPASTPTTDPSTDSAPVATEATTRPRRNR